MRSLYEALLSESLHVETASFTFIDGEWKQGR